MALERIAIEVDGDRCFPERRVCTRSRPETFAHRARLLQSESMCTVYILRCADGSLYVGRTRELSVRVAEHELGRGSAFTAARRPGLLVYQEPFQTNAGASRRERQLKRWTTAKKEALIRGDMTLVHRLAVRRRLENKPT